MWVGFPRRRGQYLNATNELVIGCQPLNGNQDVRNTSTRRLGSSLVKERPEMSLLTKDKNPKLLGIDVVSI